MPVTTVPALNGVTARERIGSALAVLVLHLGLALLLLAGLGVELAPRPEKALAVFDLPAPTPPPVIPEPRSAARSKPKGRAAPPAPRAAPKPVVAPPLVLPDPPPLLAAPVAGSGTQAAAGAADMLGPGTGAGGSGDGLGAGGAGNGTGGGGGIAVPARRVAGRISDRDYPRNALRARIQGDVTLRITVGADGRVAACDIARSSDNAELDDTTCRLVRSRFRYRPAQDAQGRAVSDMHGWLQRWWLEPR